VEMVLLTIAGSTLPTYTPGQGIKDLLGATQQTTTEIPEIPIQLYNYRHHNQCGENHSHQ
jgi:hypothetical protein